MDVYLLMKDILLQYYCILKLKELIKISYLFIMEVYLFIKMLIYHDYCIINSKGLNKMIKVLDLFIRFVYLLIKNSSLLKSMHYKVK